MLRDHARGFRAVLLGLDIALCALVFLVLAFALLGSNAVLNLSGSDAGRLLAVGLAGCATWPVLLKRRDLYTSQRRNHLGLFFTRMAGAGAIAALVLSATAFATSAPVPRLLPILCAGIQALALTGTRLAGIAGLRLLRRSGHNYRRIIIVGSGPRALAVHRTLERHPSWGLRLFAFVDDGDLPTSVEIPTERFYPLKELPDLLRDDVVDEVVVAWTRSMFSSLDKVVAWCASAGVPMTLISDFFGDSLPPPRVSFFDSYPALSFAPVHHSRSKLAIKRGADLFIAVLGMLVVSPAWAAIALAIRLDSPGPVLFRQTRVGLNGRRFEVLKFRTMYADAEARKPELAHLNEMDGPVFKMKSDPRVTRVGHWLRRSSLDELPNLLNVLLGEMSLVGPRPPTPDEVSQYEVAQRRRLSMRPGITCLWQVSGRNTIHDFSEWVKLDIEYIDNWSLFGDLKLLLRTVPAVLTGRGAS